MSKAITKTNNDKKALENKILLRLNSVKEIESNEIFVLECFGGKGLLWECVKKRTDKKITVLSIDTVKYSRFQLQGDSLKILPIIDLNKYQVVDLDSYGIPFKHADILFKRKYKGIVHCTVIQSMMGNLPNELLNSEGYTKKMMKKARTLLSRNGDEKFKNWIAKNGVKKIQIFKLNKKNYFWFKLG